VTGPGQWREKGDPPVKGEVCVRAYFPYPTDLAQDKQPHDITTRLHEKSVEQAAFKRRRLKEEAWALFTELEAQIRMQLRFQGWQPEIAAKYSRAYARHGRTVQVEPRVCKHGIRHPSPLVSDSMPMRDTL